MAASAHDGRGARVDDSPSVENPPNGWVYNTNDWPLHAGSWSQEAERLRLPTRPARTRAPHRSRVLDGKKDFRSTP
jgi:acyl-homoserine-lactone acylase